VSRLGFFAFMVWTLAFVAACAVAISNALVPAPGIAYSSATDHINPSRLKPGDIVWHIWGADDNLQVSRGEVIVRPGWTSSPLLGYGSDVVAPDHLAIRTPKGPAEVGFWWASVDHNTRACRTRKEALVAAASLMRKHARHTDARAGTLEKQAKDLDVP
jgi:hypothetical protein